MRFPSFLTTIPTTVSSSHPGSSFSILTISPIGNESVRIPQACRFLERRLNLIQDLPLNPAVKIHPDDRTRRMSVSNRLLQTLRACQDPSVGLPVPAQRSFAWS